VPTPSTIDDVHFTDRPGDLTIGVIGGMGPLATVDFFGLLVRMTPADKDWNHLHIIVDNNPRIPSRTRAMLFEEASPVPYLIDGARRLLASGAGLLVVPCNSASHFLAPVRAAVPVPILDPVRATAAAMTESSTEPMCRRPLVLGGMVTHRAELYRQALAPAGIVPVRPDDAEQDEVAALIEALKLGDTSAQLVHCVQAVVAAGVARGADSIILGCTEFGLIAAQLDAPFPVFNSNELLAKQALQLARSTN
jgi:aspartate racemase